jgi:hypothetical protein
MATCRFCGGEMVERKRMVHDTTKGHRVQKVVAQPKARWFCLNCKRVCRTVA